MQGRPLGDLEQCRDDRTLDYPKFCQALLQSLQAS